MGQRAPQNSPSEKIGLRVVMTDVDAADVEHREHGSGQSGFEYILSKEDFYLSAVQWPAVG